MTERVSSEEFDRDVAAFQLRLQDLRTGREIGGEGEDEAPAAVFLELETAAELLRVAHEELWAVGNELARRNTPGDRDRDLLRTVFKDLPVAVILLDRFGRVRRANQRATDVLGVTADYLSGKPFPVFVDLPARAALRSHLAAAARGKEEHVIATSLLRLGVPIPARLALSTVQVPADSQPVIMAVVLPADGVESDGVGRPAAAVTVAPARAAQSPHAVVAATKRLDLVASVARLVLGERGGSEAVVLHAVAILLCANFAEWVTIDLMCDGELSRAAACGPADDASLQTVSALERAVAGKAELPATVIDDGEGRLFAHVEDVSILGEDERGVPFLSAIGAHTALCVPIEADGQAMGAVTALRTQQSTVFSLTDQAALEDVAGLLALALRSDRRWARHSTELAAFRAAMSPRAGPPQPGMDVAWFHRTAGSDVSLRSGLLHFLPRADGWGAFLGDTPNDGGSAAVYLSMVRHWVSLLGLTGEEPGTLLTQLNWAMRRVGGADQPISAMATQVTVTAGSARIRLASAGHRSSLTLRADGRVQRTDGGGQPLNTGDNAEVHSDSVDLAPGELVLCYNNALFDAANSTGETFGQSGQLVDALARAARGTAQDVVDRIGAALSAFADGGIDEDVLAMAVRFIGP